MDMWVYFERKEEKCGGLRIVGIVSSQSVDLELVPLHCLVQVGEYDVAGNYDV